MQSGKPSQSRSLEQVIFDDGSQLGHKTKKSNLCLSLRNISIGVGVKKQKANLVFILEKGFNSQRNTETEVLAGELSLGVAHLLAITTTRSKSSLEI